MTRTGNPTPRSTTKGTAFGVFRHPTDESRTHVADTVDVANRLRFDGWQEVEPADPENDWQAQALAAQVEATEHPTDPAPQQ